MTLDSWITPEETPALAAAATRLIDARLARFTPGERDAFWSSIRKAYNTPYNDPVKPKAEPPAPPPTETGLVEIVVPSIGVPQVDLPIAAMVPPALAAAELRAG